MQYHRPTYREILMLRQTSPDFITIQAQGAPFGATINVLHITNVRVQPQLDNDGEATGKLCVMICCVDGIQALTYDTIEEANEEYFRISNELMGRLKEDTTQ